MSAINENKSPNIIIRGVWFLFVGWWLTGIVLAVAWLCNVTIVGLPIGIKLINKAPYTLTLKRLGSNDEFDMSVGGGESPNLIVRGLYFIIIGWWASAILMTAAYVVSLTVIGLPISVKLFNYLPYAVSLKKH